VLEKDKRWAAKLGLNYHPTLAINNFTYKGDLTYPDIIEAVCASYNKRPDECDF
jgi:protein-disulfide isomerase